ncbi:MAG: hypothetical protein K2Y09_14035 [Nitrosomonas sp.]|uniref:hypothetical protein n=1 Tax=Nitrosomonas sp. TaxID=42353 RepID=UPI001DF4DD25|nr:hypothetical protein [Nitrosomonas sp.]MBX9896265.1 hypothetical protein [Nitrosomonas sp.]
MGATSIDFPGVCCATAWCIALRLMTPYLGTHHPPQRNHLHHRYPAGNSMSIVGDA